MDGRFLPPPCTRTCLILADHRQRCWQHRATTRSPRIDGRIGRGHSEAVLRCTIVIGERLFRNSSYLRSKSHSFVTHSNYEPPPTHTHTHTHTHTRVYTHTHTHVYTHTHTHTYIRTLHSPTCLHMLLDCLSGATRLAVKTAQQATRKRIQPTRVPLTNNISKR